MVTPSSAPHSGNRPSDDAAIDVRGLSKSFVRRDTARGWRNLFNRAPAEQVWAVRDATFRVARGETLGLIGPNGAGKSTALKVLAGIYEPTAGAVDVRGRVAALLELGAGFHPDLTGRENIRLNGSILGLSRKEIDTATPAIIDFAGLADAIDAPVKTYSSGMHARLGFAIAVNLDPDVLIIDEILAVGDEEFQRRCFDHLYEMRQRGTTILVVSHAMTTMEIVCDRIVWLDHGTVRQIGPARDVVQAYLRHVNDAEGQARAEAGSTAARVGSGEIRCTSLEFLDEAGHVTTSLVTDRPATVRLQYRAEQDLPAVSAGVTFHNESGELLCAPNSREDGYFAVAAGAGHIDMTIPRVLLNPGTFAVSVHLAAFGHWFDLRDREWALTVRSEGHEQAGAMLLPVEWRAPEVCKDDQVG